MIAHELRQPLGAIESIAYYLSLVLPPGEGLAREQAARLHQLVEQSSWILNCGLQIADETPLAPVPLDLEQLIAQTIAARTSQDLPQPLLEFSGGLPLVRLDPRRGRALIENLLTLMAQVAGDVHPFHLRTSLEASGPLLEISTAVPGHLSESALGSGSALSLECARRVVSAHGGSLTVDVDPVSGIRLRAVLP